MSSPNKAYSYTAPLNSPFYHNVISPFCDAIIQRGVIPRWVTPDQLSFCGLVCAVVAVVCAKLKWYVFCAPFWVCYGLCDNLDGKQARFTKKSSRGGDFVDHAIDSIVASLSLLINMSLLVPGGIAPWVAVWLTLAGLLPFYFGAWAHHVLGRVLLGTQVHGRDLFTVDELNFLWIPAIAFLRLVSPVVLDIPLYTSWRLFPLIGRSVVTPGILIIFTIIIFSIISSVVVVRTVYRPHVGPLLIPGLAYGVLALILRPPLLVMIPCFSLLSFELIGLRLQLPHNKVQGQQRLWLPVILFALISCICRWSAVEVTWGLSNPYTATVALFLSTFTLSLLIRYKDRLNQEALKAE